MNKAMTIAAALAAAALLAGCGGDDMSGVDHGAASSAPATSGAAQAAHNDADVTFAREMAGHHQQAVTMAQLVPSRSGNDRVKDLATRIEQAQGPEIELMNGWLSRWQAAMPSHGAGHGSMPGMMSDADLHQLEQARGADFDRLWLRMMVQHHQGAVEMARTELANGVNPEAKALAQRVIDTQQAEITEMQQLLTTV